jgi:hypothetical protein
VHESHARQTKVQLRAKLNVWQIAFDAMPFGAIRVEDEHGGCPQHAESVKPCRMLLDVRRDRNELAPDETRGCIVRIGLGLQPSASASCGRGAEID